MSDNSFNEQGVPDKVVKLTVDNILKKNDVKPEEVKNNLSDEQKQMLKEMIEDLQKQVDQFNQGDKKTENSNSNE